ncbi:hypothetical protein BJ741DRAFT_585133 [Chytriomyces cf. hyalinus JEL632]|nr:hypothetical protein BJ741DRAFT_585133 [Chytriomyces cf. hyalinus JEL632]
MEMDQLPTPTLEMAKLELEQDKLNLENYKRQFEREARFYTLKKTEYEGNLRVYKNLLKAHSQWVSLLKEHIDVMHSQTTLSSLVSLPEMLDALFLHCNSKDFTSMTSEWNQRWAKTEGVFPVKQVVWSDLRERYFTINGGHTAKLDKQLGSIFKGRLMEVIPPGDREFGPLLLGIQADRHTNAMDSAVVLQQISECMADKALLRPTAKAKLTGEKRPVDSTGDKHCFVHPTATHSNEECYAQGATKKKPKTSKGASVEVKAGNQKKPAEKAPGKQATKAHPPKHTDALAAQVKALQAKLEALEKAATSSKKIQVLKTRVGEL